MAEKDDSVFLMIVGAIAVLFENLSLIPYSDASGQAPLCSAKSFDA